jgi:broad specificity phosphatase PhoE
MTLFMIRHGETTGNVQKLFYGNMDLPLTETGRDQARALRPLLENYRFDRVYSSDLSRAAETAQLALPGCSPEQTPLLREYEMGTLCGKTHQEGLALYGYLNSHYEVAGGESPAQVAARLQTFLDDALARGDERVAVFTHSGVMKTMMLLVLGMDCATSNLQSTNCNVAVFRHLQNRWTLSVWNLAGDTESESV